MFHHAWTLLVHHLLNFFNHVFTCLIHSRKNIVLKLLEFFLLILSLFLHKVCNVRVDSIPTTLFFWSFLLNNNNVFCISKCSFSIQKSLILNHDSSSFSPFIAFTCACYSSKNIIHDVDKQVYEIKHKEKWLWEPNYPNKAIISESAETIHLVTTHCSTPCVCQSISKIISSNYIL